MTDLAETAITVTDSPDDEERATIINGLRAYAGGTLGCRSACHRARFPAACWAARVGAF